MRLRSFPHSNSKRKQADRFRNDRDEIAEYTSALPTLRNGKQECPSLYDDKIPQAYRKKWPTKPKRNNIKRDSIRTKEDNNDLRDWDTE